MKKLFYLCALILVFCIQLNAQEKKSYYYNFDFEEINKKEFLGELKNKNVHHSDFELEDKKSIFFIDLKQKEN